MNKEKAQEFFATLLPQMAHIAQDTLSPDANFVLLITDTESVSTMSSMSFDEVRNLILNLAQEFSDGVDFIVKTEPRRKLDG